MSDADTIEPLPPVEPVRLLNLVESDTLAVPALLVILDKDPGPAWFAFADDAEIRVEGPVPVKSSDFETLLGYAHVYQDGKRLLATLFIRKDCPERLDIEQRRLYPNPAFSAEVWDCERKEGGGVTKATLREIALTPDGLLDERIPPIGAPLL